jgi:hypothetical protein
MASVSERAERDRDSGRQTIRQMTPPVHDGDFEPDSMEGEPVRKAVGPLLPPSATPFTHDPSIIVRSVPPPPPPQPPPPPPAPAPPPQSSRRAPTMLVRRPPAPTVKLERVREEPPPASGWRYIVVVLLTAAVVVGGAVGVRSFLAWRAGQSADAADAAPATAASVDGAVGSAAVGSATVDVDAAPAAESAPLLRPFDPDVARVALDVTAQPLPEVCKLNKWQRAKTKITFSPEGIVTSSVAQAPYQGMAPGICVARHLKDTHIPPFKGPPGTMVYQTPLRP